MSQETPEVLPTEPAGDGTDNDTADDTADDSGDDTADETSDDAADETTVAPATVDTPAPPPAAAALIESPPLSAQPPREAAPDPRMRLHQLAAELMQSRNQRLLFEYLQLRRALR